MACLITALRERYALAAHENTRLRARGGRVYVHERASERAKERAVVHLVNVRVKHAGNVDRGVP